jgi:hypothetical protein
VYLCEEKHNMATERMLHVYRRLYKKAEQEWLDWVALQVRTLLTIGAIYEAYLFD